MSAKAMKPDGQTGRVVNRVFLHCSDSAFGDVATIRKWHVEERGWKDIGYHYVVLNGRRSKSFSPADNGLIEDGRHEWEDGAHAEGHNHDSLAICLIGDAEGKFTVKQMRKTVFLVKQLMARYALSPDMVFAHNQVSTKACPGFDIEDFRALLRG